ncbi:Protein mlp1 [Sporothrix eucalyptigena]|uniref:Protein mlp1 n=1 Tax=Sporothrix eucalyptigena TaxID=1812306 RepID=A0ABP0D1B4_9PEZI
MAAAAVDVGYLSTHLGVPETSLSSAVTAPTAELVKTILDAVVTKAHEFDALYAAKLNVDIELESVVRSSEARSESFKTAAETSRKDVDELRRKLQDEENVRRGVENELQTLKASTANTQAEIERLASRNASLEASNRDTLSILESKTSANAEIAEELQAQHQKTLKLNQEVTALQQAVQTAQATTSSAKFREQSLQQELAFARKNNEWFEAELKTKSEESLKLRKEKGARIAELQRQNEEAQSTVDALTRSEKQLRTRLEDAQRKADEALAKVQQLQEAASRSEESFRAELESSARLVELKEQQTETHRNRLREVELRLEQVKDESADEVRRVRNEMEQLRQDLQQAEKMSQDLEAEVDRVQAMLSTPMAAAAIAATPSAQPGSAPQTPRANGGGNGSLLRAASPFGTPGSVLRGKSSISAAQAMEELYKTKGELARERRRTQELGQELDEIMSALEAKSPEIADLQEEAERLRSENVQISRLCEESFSERDIAKKAAKKAEASSITAQAEIEILRTQLRDLSTQIQLLVFNIQAREKGLDELSEEEARQFERLQRGQVAEGCLDDMSDTHQFISERFVVFKDIQELQEKNAELLRLTRELAFKMESEEASDAKRQVEQDRAELAALRDTVGRLQDESKAVTVRMKSYMTERDMFRRMLQQKASHAEIASVMGDGGTLGQTQREVLASIEQNSSGADDGELTVALRELQNNFDAYRNEQGVDRQTMRAQVDKLSNERSALQGEIARINSQLTLASERYEILQSNYTALETDNKALQEKNQSLSESYAKQDIRTQQVAMDLVEVRSLLESMRNENANLKAEKSLWKGIQDRLAQDNESLNQDKSRLNTLLSSQQSLLNERELSESETKRRLQTQIDNLDAELTTTKRKLSEEIEDAKKLQLRKEYDAQQSQKRIDDLMASITQSKEELVATKTSRDHLQARVNELTIELRNAEERTQRLQPRPTPRAPPAQTDADAQDGADGGDSASREQELESELADLRRDLELAQMELASSKEEANSYKDIAQTIEEDLNNLSEAQEQYRQEMDSALEAKEARIRELEQRVEALSAELATSTNELNGLRDSQADLARKFDDEKRILESEIARLKDSEDRYKDEKKYHQSDLRAQAEIATRAQKDYEQELVKHAEAAKQLQVLRSEHNHLRTEAASWRAEADSAKLALTQSESSWEERRQQFEQELLEIKARRDDTNAQNKLLGQQLESVTAQITSLQQSRASAGTPSAGGDNSGAAAAPSAFADAATEGLRELNNYLRREKEILEVQYDLKLQENQRLQQKHDYVQSQLDEARLKLEQERRAQADVGRSSQTHKELMEKLNELNLIRESNVTLRNDNQHVQAQLVLKDGTIQQLRNQIQPLEQRVAELENQKLFMDEEVKQITEDRERWQKRTESILSKYGRVDPTELDQLKESMAALEAEKTTLQSTETELRAKIQELETSLETDRGQWRETRQKLIEQAKEKARQQGAQIRELTGQKTELQEQANAATTRLSTVEQELEAANNAKTALEGRVSALQQQQQQQTEAPAQAASAPVASMDVDDQSQQQSSDVPAGGLSAEDTALLQQEVHQLRGELEVVRTEKAAIEQELISLRTQLDSAVEERDHAVAQAQAASGVEGAAAPATNGFTAPAADAGATLTDAEKEELQQRIAAAEARAAEFEKKAQEVEENIQATLKERSDKMKDALNKRLKESREKQEQELREAREKMQSELDLRVEQEKKIWMAEQAASAPAATDASSTTAAETTAAVPSTPAKAEPGAATPFSAPPTPTTAGTPVDLSKLGDTETRELLANNPTIRSIVTANIKKKIDSETKRVREEIEQAVKAEYETKITAARDSGQMMAEKKSSIRINMAENKLKTANAKLDVVSTAAVQTPQRPVAEVWNIAKDARPPPAQAAPGTPGPATPAPSTPAPAQAQPVAALNAFTPTTQPAPATGALRPPQQQQQPPPISSLPIKPQPATNLPPSSLPAPISGPPALNNPFLAKPADANQAANPFAKNVQQQQQQQQQQSQLRQPQQQQQQNQQQQQGGPRSGIPVPGGGRGGAQGGNSNRGGTAGGAGRGGVYQAPRGRGRGGIGQNPGRGGGATGSGGAGALNPSADTFNPSNKRQRNDNEAGGAGGGVKRMRGGGGPGGPAGGQAGGAGGQAQ